MGRQQQLRIAAYALLLLAASATQAHTRSHSRAVRVSADEPGLRSASALVLDATHASVLYSRKADVSAPIASITKLMTALVVADAGLPLDEPITLTAEDRIVGKGAHSRLTLGATLTRGDLIHLALMSSENRAAHAL
ncbi:MAG TPA: serine hydrolase, partial [Steroidobacteraceae bacterium]|nr:serine hydrolase [Steroidobacteraceae bacterium]